MSPHVSRGTMVAGRCRNKQRTVNNKVLEGKQKTPCKQVSKPGTHSAGRQEKRAHPSSYRLSADKAEGGTSACREGGTVTMLFPRLGHFSPARVPWDRMLVARTDWAWQGLLPRPAQSLPTAPEGEGREGKDCILLLRGRLQMLTTRNSFQCPISTPISTEEASTSHCLHQHKQCTPY